MYRLFTTFFDTPTAPAARRWAPAIDLIERDDEYVVSADVPGVKAQDVTIEVKDNVLTLSGERRSEATAKSGGFVRVERASGRFARAISLPKGIDAEAIAASFEDGVLQISIPKPAERKPVRVAINAGEPAAIES